VWAEEHEDAWHVRVQDDGVGIDPADRERIFGMFQRVGDADDDGTGIGLAVSRRIAERHGGRLWVDPAPEGGSVFTFSLPRVPGTTANGGRGGRRDDVATPA
jgi:signal transduction histidine kinase